MWLDLNLLTFGAFILLRLNTRKNDLSYTQGMNCLTEMYSAIEAEVPIPSDPTTTENTELLNALADCGRVR